MTTLDRLKSTEPESRPYLLDTASARFSQLGASALLTFEPGTIIEQQLNGRVTLAWFSRGGTGWRRQYVPSAMVARALFPGAA